MDHREQAKVGSTRTKTKGSRGDRCRQNSTRTESPGRRTGNASSTRTKSSGSLGAHRDKEQGRRRQGKDGGISKNAYAPAETLLLGLNSMPFGAVASVSSFLRISIDLWAIGLRLLKIVWSCFFDDFSVAARECLESSAAWSVETLFRLLGIDFAETGRRAVGFGKCFRMLG